MGLALLVIMALTSVYVVATYPPNYGAARWGENRSLSADKSQVSAARMDRVVFGPDAGSPSPSPGGK